MTLEMQDFDELQDAALRQLEIAITRSEGNAEGRVGREIERLETEAQQIYRFVVLLQKNEQDLDKVAEIWGKMVMICDAFAGKVAELSQRFPGHRLSADRILDLRSAAEERRQLHAR